MSFAVLLVDPKYPHNVGGSLRACACFGAARLAWTGDRVPPPDRWPAGARLPREERLRLYRIVDLGHVQDPDPVGTLAAGGRVPVAVENRHASESLVDFVHPDAAVYVFGPEDGSLARGVLEACHRFVRIPTTGPLNLAAAVNVVLYDRLAKTPCWPDPR